MSRQWLVHEDHGQLIPPPPREDEESLELLEALHELKEIEDQADWRTQIAHEGSLERAMTKIRRVLIARGAEGAPSVQIWSDHGP